jgi:chorismate mutase / prephenate dehydratase
MNGENTDESAWRRLESFRTDIDRIDERILDLLSHRQAAAEGIGRVKRMLNLDIVDPAREQHVLDRLSSRARGRLDPDAIRTIYSGIIAVARGIQEPPSIGFLGPEGTFSHEASRQLYGETAAYRPLQSVEDIFYRVARAECSTGIVPLENSSEGPVMETLDLFAQYDLTIRAEVRLPVRHQLMSLAADPKDIQRLYSHPMALAQCSRWIRNHLPGIQTEAVSSTASAVDLVAGDPASAAVGSRLAGEIAGVPILRQDIQDLRNNVTRFVMLGRGPVARDPSDKDCTSLLIGLEHRPGTLLGVIGPLAAHNVNITRIDSRPRKDRPWEYLFFLDLDGNAEEEPLAGALDEISQACSMIKRLGSYPREDER